MAVLNQCPNPLCVSLSIIRSLAVVARFVKNSIMKIYKVKNAFVITKKKDAKNNYIYIFHTVPILHTTLEKRNSNNILILINQARTYALLPTSGSHPKVDKFFKSIGRQFGDCILRGKQFVNVHQTMCLF